MKELWTLAVYTYVCVLFTFVGTTHESNIRMFVCTYQPQSMSMTGCYSLHLFKQNAAPKARTICTRSRPDIHSTRG